MDNLLPRPPHCRTRLGRGIGRVRSPSPCPRNVYDVLQHMHFRLRRSCGYDRLHLRPGTLFLDKIQDKQRRR